MTNDLLHGKIKIEIFKLALPLFFGCLLQQLYNTVDSLVVGHFLGTIAFASTGVSGTVMNLFIFLLNGFCVGSSILFGQKFGAGKPKEFRESVFTALSAGVVLTIVLSILSISLLRPILKLIQTPDELIGYCSSYLKIILGGLILTYLYNLFSALLRSIGNTRASLVFLFIATVLNIILDILFIAVFNMGVSGAAAATVIAQGISALCCLIFIKSKYNEYIFSKNEIGFYPELLSQALKLGLVSALHQSSLYLGKMLVQGAVNSIGTSAIAAFTATSRIEGFLGSVADSFSQSISIHISQNYGAGNTERVYKALRKGMSLLHLLFIILLPLVFIFARGLIDLFLNGADPAALAMGVKYLRLISPFYILCFSGYSYVGFYRGTGRLTVPLFSTTLQITTRVVFSYILVSKLGLPAVAWATGAGWILVFSSYSIIYLHLKNRDLPKIKKKNA